jgi:hypothetical protein
VSAIELAVCKVALPRLQEVRANSIESILGGTLTEKRYGYACGYIKACDDLAKILEQVITDIQES